MEKINHIILLLNSIMITTIIIYIISKLKFTLFCKHDYNLVNQYELKSEYDIVQESGRTPNTHCSLTRRLITDYKCTKCGKIKRLTAKIPR